MADEDHPTFRDIDRSRKLAVKRRMRTNPAVLDERDGTGQTPLIAAVWMLPSRAGSSSGSSSMTGSTTWTRRMRRKGGRRCIEPA